MNNESSIVKRCKVVHYILCFAVLYLSNGMYPFLHISAFVRQILLTVLVLVSSLVLNKQIILHKSKLLLAFIFVFIQMVSVAFNGIKVDSDVFLLMSILIAYLFCSNIKYNDFLNLFSNIICFISFVSVVLFVFFYMFPTVQRILPSFIYQQGSSDSTFTLLWTFVFKVVSQYSYYRNFAIFIEPGRFQIFICIGLFIEFFYEKKIRWKYLIIYFLALLTCGSTNGFVSGVIIILAYVINNNSNESLNNKIFRLLIVLLFLIIVLDILYNENSTLKVYIDKIVEKLSGLNVSNYSYQETGSALDRRRSFDVALRMFVSNPVIGTGYNGWVVFKKHLSSYDFIMTFSPLNWFARFGFLYGVLANFFFVTLFCSRIKKIRCKLLIAIAMILMISTQEVTDNQFIWILIFYGFEQWYQKYVKYKRMEQ